MDQKQSTTLPALHLSFIAFFFQSTATLTPAGSENGVYVFERVFKEFSGVAKSRRKLFYDNFISIFF